MSTSKRESDPDRTPDRTADNEVSDLRAQLDFLEEENRRLRAEYARAKQTQYRRTAGAFLGLGVVSLVAGVLFPAVRTVLIAVGATGVFAAVLLYFLTPERFVAASVGERVYRTLANNYTTLAADLGLSEKRVYLPLDTDANASRLFVPQHSQYDIPDSDALDLPFVVTDSESERGLSLRPVGQELFDEFERALSGQLADDPRTVADQLTDALLQQFELIESASVDGDDGQLSIGLSGVAYSSPDRFDHPAVSLLAVGLAHTTDAPVTVEVTDGDDRFEYLVILQWSSE